MAVTAQTGTEAPAGGAGGLPQFDATWWGGEIVWFCAIFALVYLLMAKVFVPRVGGTIDEREDRISGDIAKARQLKEQAEVQAAEAEADMGQARARAQALASEAKSRVQAEAAKRQAVEEAKLAETLGKAEAAIRSARDEAMGHVQSIAADTAMAVVEKLTGQPASRQDVERALAHRT